MKFCDIKEIYKNIKIEDNLFDVKFGQKIDSLEKEKEFFTVLRTKTGNVSKISKYIRLDNTKEIICTNVYEYSNIGNLKGVSTLDNKGIKVKDIFDYSENKKVLKEKRFYKNDIFVKKEEYCKSVFKIYYYFKNSKYCIEFFNYEEIYPFKVEYYNEAGLKI